MLHVHADGSCSLPNLPEQSLGMERGPQAANRATSTGDPGCASVHPPETNVQSPLTPEQTGVADHADCSLDPLRTWNPSINFRHTGWAHDRRRVYDSLRRTGQSGNRIHDFTGCGQHSYVFQSVEDPEVYTLGGSACHDRFCLPCGRERSRVIAANIKLKTEGKPARFLTLTLKSTTEPLADLLAKLTADFSALRRSKLWRKRVTGGVGFLEVKWIARSERWHPHLHCLVQGRFIPQDELSKTWLKITETSKIVDIRIANDDRCLTNYICKYASKPLDHTVVVNPVRLDEAVVALKGKRLCMTFGTWRGYKLTDPPESGTWVQLGTLAEIITLAEDGDADAQHALDILRVEYAPSTRAPPTSIARTVSSMILDQQCFNFSQANGHELAVSGTRFVEGE